MAERNLIQEADERYVPDYMPIYDPGTQLLRCLTCAAVVSSGDTEVHDRHHGNEMNVRKALKSLLAALRPLFNRLG